MNVERWERLNEIFHAALALAPEARAACLADSCAGDAELCAEVMRLLVAHDRAGSFIEVPAIPAAPWLNRENEPPAAGRRFGAYRVVSEIARGGMGSVYLAERADGQYERRVALKLIKRGMDTDLVLRRFRAERQILASLEHPNIARLLDGGTSEDGQPYFVMDYIEGEPIDRYAHSRNLPIPERLRLFLQVCDAVACAHRQRIIHRDIKPANLLVTRDGVAKLLDFGIAKVLEPGNDGATRSPTGFRLLTPEYASPEQVAGRHVTEASDVYSLGAVLYELLTGHTPHQPDGRDPLDLAEAVLTMDPERPSAAVRRKEAVPHPRWRGFGRSRPPGRAMSNMRSLARQLHGDLDTIVLTALRKEPDRRYPSVDQMANDIRRYLDELPVRARPDTLRYRADKFLRRNRATTIAAGVACLATSFLLGAASFAVQRASGDQVGVNPTWSSVLGVSTLLRGTTSDETPVLAVGQLEHYGTPDTLGVAYAVTGMLATNLGRVPHLQVVSSARLHEVRAILESTDGPTGWRVAARRAGAGELLEGALHTTSAGLRLDLRRVDLRTGAVRATYAVSAADAFELVDRATAQIGSKLGRRGGPLRLAEVTTASLVAYRFYEEGLRAYTTADYRSAARLFEAALREDSSFAMAAHFSLLTRDALHQPIPRAEKEWLLRLADGATERERLLIRGNWTPYTKLHELNAIADTLIARYPTEPDGHYLLGMTLSGSGDFLGALPHLARVVAMDSLGLRGARPLCRACESLGVMVDSYLYADSSEAAERIARDWVRLQPGSARARNALASSLEAQDRYDEALAARRRAVTISPGHRFDALFPALMRIRTGEFAAADRLLRDLARDGTPEVQREALWFLTISLRNQGRLREALENTSRMATPPEVQHRAQVLFEMGRLREAEALFDSIVRLPMPDLSPGGLARHRSWNLTHRAVVLASLGDTAALAVLADSIETWGHRSYYGRDPHLHHHVRGLILVARGTPDRAAMAFRRAIYSTTHGYTRTNLELAQVLLALQRPRDAVALLQSALRGGLEGSNLYMTHTELHELAGRAWEASGRVDSAAIHYRRVLDAWRGADPVLHPRRDSVRARLTALGVQTR